MPEVYYFDGENLVLCEDCAKDSEDNMVPHFRPVSEHIHDPNNSECDGDGACELYCDQCSCLIGGLCPHEIRED